MRKRTAAGKEIPHEPLRTARVRKRTQMVWHMTARRYVGHAVPSTAPFRILPAPSAKLLSGSQALETSAAQAGLAQILSDRTIDGFVEPHLSFGNLTQRGDAGLIVAPD
jgi:hypothetical protein